MFFLGSDDFPGEAKVEAARSMNAMLQAGWPEFRIDARVALADIARAHEQIEAGGGSGRVVLLMERN